MSAELDASGTLPPEQEASGVHLACVCQSGKIGLAYYDPTQDEARHPAFLSGYR